VRAVLDPNVIISALLTPRGTPARIVRLWLIGAFEFITSESLLAELERALKYPKLRDRIRPSEAQQLVELLRSETEVLEDPADAPAVRSPDPADDYLIALAESTRAALVSGDRHLLGLRHILPVYAPAEFLALLERSGDAP
jgi:uncharacterized protein